MTAPRHCIIDKTRLDHLVRAVKRLHAEGVLDTDEYQNALLWLHRVGGTFVKVTLR